jgi:4-alpha-glucanotransferase
VPDRSRFSTGRHAGVLVPLFSIPSERSWGIGEIPDLVPLAAWLRAAGLGFVQLLPINEMEQGQSSPYSAMSAMAIDPIFIALRDVEELRGADVEGELVEKHRERLAAARASQRVDYAAVRELKSRAFGKAFQRFRAVYQDGTAPRAAAFLAFKARADWWLAEYSLFRALHYEQDGRYWLEWPEELRARDASALRAARERLEERILFYEYLQFIADEQWQRAREGCGEVGIFGDFPFMVSSHSADVWSRQDEFRVDVSVGVPPDAFSETGQDWGLPAYRWDVMARDGYTWLDRRSRRCTDLFDGFRVDHLVGFYRTFVRDREGRTCFMPADESAQLAQGERLMRLFASHGAAIIAEDLGTVPDFVRESMAKLGVPGLKVFRWEREWNQPQQPFKDPATYPAVSVAISGTHDTETMAEWWENATNDERRAVVEVPSLRAPGLEATPAWSDRTRDGLIEALFAAGSNLMIVAFQDIFGWRDRINTPASVGKQNWTWRLPGPIDHLASDPTFLARAEFLRGLAAKYGRV